MHRCQTAFVRAIALALLTSGLALSTFAQSPAPKRLLVIGETKDFQHDSISHAMTSLSNWGRETGLWKTTIRTDTQLITNAKVPRDPKTLKSFDAVAFFTTGELPMNDEQKAALMSFVKDEGKGFIAMHSAADTFYSWPEYGELVGGYFDGHPWNTFKAPIVVEDADHPTVKHFPKSFVLEDEIYQYKNFSRDNVRVLLRLDESKVNMSAKGINRKDGDFPIAWVKNHGKGRVFATTIGHTEAAYDNPQVKTMMIEAVKWVMGMTEGHTQSHPKP